MSSLVSSPRPLQLFIIIHRRVRNTEKQGGVVKFLCLVLILNECVSNSSFVLQLDIALAFHRREPDPFTPVKLIIIIESPIGLINLKEICQFGTRSAKHLRLVAVTFGSDDFLARLGKYI